MKEQQLIRGLKDGDSKALEFAYLSYRQSFLSYAKKFPLDDDTMIDIYQNAIIALRENAMNGHIDTLKSEVKTYVFSIGKYMIYKELKSQKKMFTIQNDTATEFKEEVVDIELFNDDLNDQQKQLQLAFKSLGETCKKILTLFYYRGFDLEEITESLKYANKDVVKSQKSRCIKSLKALIERK